MKKQTKKPATMSATQRKYLMERLDIMASAAESAANQRLKQEIEDVEKAFVEKFPVHAAHEPSRAETLVSLWHDATTAKKCRALTELGVSVAEESGSCELRKRITFFRTVEKKAALQKIKDEIMLGDVFDVNTLAKKVERIFK